MKDVGLSRILSGLGSIGVNVERTALFVLDLDGTLADLPIEWDVCKRQLRELALKRTGKEILFTPLSGGLEELKSLDEDGAFREGLAQLREVELQAAQRCHLYPDVLQLLAAYPRVPLAVFSDNSRGAVEEVLRRAGISDRVTVIVGREDGFSPKPSPAGLEHIVRETGVDPSTAVFIGNTEKDRRAGMAASIPTLVLSRDEVPRLTGIAGAHSYITGFNGRLAAFRAGRIRQLVPRGGVALDLGCGEGSLAAHLEDYFERIVGVDGSLRFLLRNRRRSGPKRPLLVAALLEEVGFNQQFDCVILSGVLEHVADPLRILRSSGLLLASGGRLVVLVPNAESLHRRVGRLAGLISDVHELQEHDLAVGHRRYYDRETLKTELEAAGLEVEELTGLLVKPFPNSVMEELSAEILERLFEASERFPRLCAEIIAVCRSH